MNYAYHDIILSKTNLNKIATTTKCKYIKNYLTYLMQQKQQGHKHLMQPRRQYLMHFPKHCAHFSHKLEQLHFKPSEETFTCVRYRQQLLAKEAIPFINRQNFLEFIVIPHSTQLAGRFFSIRQTKNDCGNSTKALTKKTSVRSSTYSGIFSSAERRWFWTIW